MNRIDRQPLSSDEAELEYLDGEYRIRKPGAYVRCAVTGDPIALQSLRYWDVARQLPFRNAETAFAERLKRLA